MDTVLSGLTFPGEQINQDMARAGLVKTLADARMFGAAISVTETISSNDLRSDLYCDFATAIASISSVNHAYVFLAEFASAYDVSPAVRVLNATDFAVKNPDLAEASASLELRNELELEQFRYLVDMVTLLTQFHSAEPESAWKVVSASKQADHYPMLLERYFELVGAYGTPSQRSWATKQLDRPAKLGLTASHQNAMVIGAAQSGDFDFIRRLGVAIDRPLDGVLALPITTGLLRRYQSLERYITAQLALAQREEPGFGGLGDL
jgi:hypothetical protein